MKNIGEQLNPQEVEDMIKEADQDQDGRITYEGIHSSCQSIVKFENNNIMFYEDQMKTIVSL
jgi:hypothetical protein